MAKSARRRNAKKTVGRKKRLTNGYRRKTMRKRQKGGVDKDGVKEAEGTAAGGGDSDALSTNSDQVTSLTSSPISQRRRTDAHVNNAIALALGEQPMNKAEYTIRKQGDSWLVTININGTEETYVVPDDILSKVRNLQVTAVG